MPIRVCVAGATGVGGAVTKRILASPDFNSVSAIGRRYARRDIGEALGLPKARVTIAGHVEEALAVPADVLIDYTLPGSVKEHTLSALNHRLRVVVGTSGLTAADYAEISERPCKLG